MRIATTSPLKALPFTTKPRFFILSDIANKPDDTQFLCRYFSHANHFNTKGIVATISTWLRDMAARHGCATWLRDMAARQGCAPGNACCS
ncbi:hypothetical protein DER46DRAFT_118063 [Fusarium sp. MPI-SDFR-AT-0072]|nr:hypothetical protein DER46DRAFT_118063 [Fusarium sp. MPI-SDFR-AT-0072]